MPSKPTCPRFTGRPQVPPLWLATSLICLLASSCAPDQDTRLNTVLITLDTTRADALPTYGNTEGKMPHLDLFAGESLVFDYAHTVAPLTLPSHASMLTGLYPVRHSIRINGPHPLPAQAHTLAEAASAAGYQTAAFVAASVLNAPMGLAQGFAHFGSVAGTRSGGHKELERSAGDVVDEALGWLEERNKARPFLLWMHFFDPHAPYTPDAAFKGKTANPYFDELAYVDHQLGRFLRSLKEEGLLEETLILLAADHGEGFGEHDEDSHGWLTYEGVLRVPMILRYPDKSRAGERSLEVVSVVDIAPTLADAMQISLGDDIDGISLFHHSVPEQRGVYFETYQGYEAQRWSPIHGWLDAKGKYIHSTAPEWYDPRLDAKEQYNLVEGIDTNSYLDALRQLSAKTRLDRDEKQVDAEQMQSIEDLGYASSIQEEGDLPDLLEPTGLPIPALMIRDERILRQAMQMHARGQFKAARPLLLGILSRNENNPVGAEVLAYGYNKEGRYGDAQSLLTKLIGRGIRWPNVLFLLGHALEKQGDLLGARKAYGDALVEDPNWKPALEALDKLP